MLDRNSLEISSNDNSLNQIGEISLANFSPYSHSLLRHREVNMEMIRPVSDLSMEAFENLQFESDVYSKLKEAEQEAELTDKRYSSKDVLKAMKSAIGGDQIV